MRRSVALLLPLVLLGSGYGSCAPPLIENTGFDLWCGDSLCYWTVEKGQVARTTTWHELDYGIELIGPQVAITQRAEQASITCMELEMLAQVDPGTQVTFEADFGADGTVEDTALVAATSDWASVSARVELRATGWRLPDHERVLVRLRKEGSGRAQLAQIVVYEC